MKSKILSDDPRGTVIIIEGLPGTGKSTLLHDQYKLLCSSYSCVCYREETSQPLDLFRQAVLPIGSLENEVKLFLRQEPDSRLSLEQWLAMNSYDVGNYSIVAYTQTATVDASVRHFASGLKRYDIGDGRSSFEDYAYYHKIVWQNFVNNIYNRENVYLTEGAMFHNQLFDLIGFYQLSDSQLYAYYKSLLSVFDGIRLKFMFIYADDPASLLRQTGQSRKQWYSQLEQWLMYAPWAKERELHGESGMLLIYNRIQWAHIFLQKELGLQIERITRF